MKKSKMAAFLALALSASAGSGYAQSSESSAVSNESTQRLIERFTDAYASHDSATLARTVTKGFSARLYTTQHGSTTPLSVGALTRSWHRKAQFLPVSYISHSTVAVYPTPKARTVFVTYRITGETGMRVALVEVRGLRVSGIQDFPASAESARSANGDLEVASN